ncbi:MAG: small ribosomal subunit biogenesis GTPase RsgA [Pseudohongiellaceae bacterium]
MGKRKLTRQQQTRVKHQQQEKKQDAEASHPDEESKGTGHAAPGIVICNYGRQLDVESLAPGQEGRILRCHQRANLPDVVTGDRVVWEPDGENTGVVVAVEDRQSVLVRPNKSGDLKPVAANIDLVCIVVALLPKPFMNMIDRYLAAVETLDLNPLLILNKTDLINHDNRGDIDNMLSTYEQIGYSVARVSATAHTGMDRLNALLKGKVAVFVGQSGVGKSSLINALAPHDPAVVGAMSMSRDKGTHTTTASRLHHLDFCDLIDSPGIREFGLWHIDSQHLLHGFIEFRPYTGACRFRDCMHHGTPGCALEAAAAAGEIDPRRLQSYLHILETLGSKH